MGLLSRSCVRCNVTIRILLKTAKSATSLAHSKGPVTREEPDVRKSTNDIKIDKETIAKLEKISLVDFGNEDGIRRLEAAVRFAEKLKEVPLDPSVKPMYSVLQKERLELREDKVTEGNCRKEILRNAKVVEDEYFIAPLGDKCRDS